MAPFVKPSEAELERRRTIQINDETVTNISSTDFPGHYPGEDNSWSFETFKNTFRVEHHYLTPAESSFSLIGADAAIANALRRILISEIPTLAIETVYVYNNTSVIQDEVLCHRLGLIPFTGSKKGIREFLRWRRKAEDGTPGPVYDYNTVQLRLQVECTRNPSAAPDEREPTKLYHHAHVYARDIEFVPAGRQADLFQAPEDIIRPVNPDILVAKLRPGQVIDLQMHMHKGVGADHAKFSPVATASYRLLPTITITRPILGRDADKFARCFPRGVIALERVSAAEANTPGSGYEGHEGEKKAVVADPMKDTVSRECLRHPEFEGKVKLGRRRDHFIFSIESTGQWDSDELLLEAIKTMKKKCERLEKQVINMVR
ncbi:DNA-directed RNA polymerases I and III subunit RPAC1 [Sodiomyces alkalinus F11]|uniref:DNA-directed RNA polymerases I and III subunit RPAC1 n=1 Tax=Sodiomyces alkalinus (strain CBS 110278 / VKM F-3762 / F11) TaxID=1314773 RepID=A0A3N2PRW8_SODAK|nr:DNA-directed RNA polymerases I and III subunit RPAC1 [Sodiomyces alkalinus F11]ROT37247.1 DNA-directed RNA polymerases I and III subunit RPAC1 [Sodiomyces alkalinus F11]